MVQSLDERDGLRFSDCIIDSAPAPGAAAFFDGQGTTALAQSVARIQQQCAEILEQVKAMSEQLSQLAVRESELRAVLERDGELDPHQEPLLKTLRKPRTPGRVTAAIDAAPLHLEPFPYAIIDNLLPITLYRSLLRGLPPVELFANKPAGKQHLNVPFTLPVPPFRRG